MEMNINMQDLFLALRELKWSIDEAKNMVFNGKVVQCDRKLQGAQVRCNNILKCVGEVLSEIPGTEQQQQQQEERQNVASETTEKESL